MAKLMLCWFSMQAITEQNVASFAKTHLRVQA